LPGAPEHLVPDEEGRCTKDAAADRFIGLLAHPLFDRVGVISVLVPELGLRT